MAKDRPRLGRGLSSLIPHMDSPVLEEVVVETLGDTSAQAHVDGDSHHRHDHPTGPSATRHPFAIGDGVVTIIPPNSVMDVPVDDIRPNPSQPRRSFDQASLADLASSLKTTGLVQPIAIRRIGQHFELIAGERRLRAARLAGLATIPAIIREVDSSAQAQMALIENIHREDLNPIDRAEAYKTLTTHLGVTQQQLADRLGEQRSSIANYLRLLELVPNARAHVAGGKLSLGHAKILAGIAETAEQSRLAELCVHEGLSVRSLERIVAGTSVAAAPPKSASPTSAHLADLEKSIARQIGMRVQVRKSGPKGRGKLVIHYGSLEQFDELMQRLNVEVEE